MEQPSKVQIVEVGPRDGFQNIKTQIPTEDKLQTIALLVAAGITRMEVTSFVHPKAIPQMADAMEVAKAVVSTYSHHGMEPIALVPNARGAENALACGVRTVTYVISASESHNKANVNRTKEQSCEDLKALIRAYPELNVRLAVATAFGCPFEGAIGDEAVLGLADLAVEAGVKEIIFCDTIGIAGPRLVEHRCQLLRDRFPVPIGMHFHDTRGMGLANTLMALQQGIHTFETSVGGLGGCPFAPGAAGNTATEDLLFLLREMGIETGVDLETYLNAVAFVDSHIHPTPTEHIYRADVCAKRDR